MSGVFVAKVTCKLQHEALATVLAGDDAIPLLGDVVAGDEPNVLLQSATDFAPYKPKFDFLVTANAYAPGKVPTPNWAVRCQVGEWSKSLRIAGPRKWTAEMLSFRATAPVPIANLPVDYRLAFGGPSCKRNPIGRGYDQGEWLPNIELLDRPVQSPRDDLPPAGFGPIAPSWFPRPECLGTYDSHWQKTHWPWYPADFDYAFFNAAPPDQQFDRPLAGNEVLEFENLHPEHAIFRTRLPSVRVRCFISRFEAKVLMPAEQFTEVPLYFDTLQVDLNKELATLLWRGNAPVDSLKMTEIKTLFMMVESVDAPPQSHAACIDHFRRLRLDQMGLHDTRLDELTEEPDSRREFEKQMAASNAEVETRLREAEAQQAIAIEQAIAAGADPAMFDQPPPPNSSPRAAVAEAKASLKQTADSLRADNPELAQKIDKEVVSLEEVEAMLPRELTREQVEPMIAARESFVNCSLVGLDLEGLDFSGLDCSTANFSKAKLRGANFTGCNLSKANLREADLTQACMTSAGLDQADFSGAAWQECQFVAASINNTVFAEQQLVGNDFSNAQGRAANFSKAKLLKCNFNGAKLPSSDFTAAEIVESSFEGAELKAAQFENVRAQKVRMRGADLSGIHASDGSDFTDALFEQVQAVGSIWQESILDRANFSESKLSQALFTSASLIQAKFDRSDLTKAVLDDANLQRASLDQCNLLYASLDRANLSDARMREANIYNAGFWDAKLENLDRRGTSVKGTVLPHE